jgi:Tol biopolymer transport system component
MNGLEKIWSGSDYSVSNTGTLVYAPDMGPKNLLLFASVDLKGNVQPLMMPLPSTSEFSLSPNGRYIAARLFSVSNDDIWVYDLAVGTPQRLTFEPLDEIDPVWTPDGKRIAFGTRTGKIFWKLSDGTGQREELTSGDYPRYPLSFSRDGKFMAFEEMHPSRKGDIWLMPLDGDRKPQPLLTTNANERDAKFSPDSRWLAYASNETGQDQIFIRSVGGGGVQKQLSSDGGIAPIWAPNNRDIYFLKGEQLVTVSIDGEGNPTSRDRVLFTAPTYQDARINPDSSDYGIMPDGQHFVFKMGQVASGATYYNVVLNWFEELKQHVPGK